jgi:hypothetical protein
VGRPDLWVSADAFGEVVAPHRTESVDRVLDIAGEVEQCLEVPRGEEQLAASDGEALRRQTTLFR